MLFRSREPHAFLRKEIGLADSDLTAMDRGQAVAKSLRTKASKEIAVLGVVQVRVPKEFFLDEFRDIARFKKSEFVTQIGRFSEPPRPEDLEALTLERSDLDGLTTCRVGKCDMKLPGPFIARLRAEVDWNSPNHEARANAVWREVFVDYINAYLARGHEALAAYEHRKASIDPVEEFRTLLRQSLHVYGDMPALHEYLQEFPNATLPHVENFVYWSKEHFGLKPVINLTHVAIYRPPTTGGEVLIASKNIYSSHYIDASLGLTVLVDCQADEGAACLYLMYLNRSRIDALGGAFGKIKHAIVAGKQRQGMVTLMTKLKTRLEQDYRARITARTSVER